MINLNITTNLGNNRRVTGTNTFYIGFVNIKSWYKSKTIWTALAVFVCSVAPEFGIVIPESAFGVLGALGLCGVRDAVGKK